MKKRVKIILSLTLAAIMLALTAVSAQALPAPMTIGDVDGDNQVTIMDATRIQRWLAELEDELMTKYGDSWPQKLQEYIGDIDNDGSCSILDATYIQRMIAGLIPKGDLSTWAYYIESTRFYADYNSGKAQVGKPVTFTAEIPHYGGVYDSESRVVEPYTYEFSINGKVVQPRSEKNTLTYIFEEAGNYNITVTFYNALDCSETRTLYSFPQWDYQVVEPYNTDNQPVIVSAIFPEDTDMVTGYGPLVVRAEGGSGGYQYQYTIEGGPFVEGNGWTYVRPDDNILVYPTYTTGWIDSNSVEMPQTEEPGRAADGVIKIIARDKNGVCSEPQQIYYEKDIKVG